MQALLTAEARDPKWNKVRKQHLKLFPSCAACGLTQSSTARKIVAVVLPLAVIELDVHHIKPFHLFPELELDPTNLITLCHYHHFHVGHFGNWQLWNPHVVEDAAKLLARGMAA